MVDAKELGKRGEKIAEDELVKKDTRSCLRILFLIIKK